MKHTAPVPHPHELQPDHATITNHHTTTTPQGPAIADILTEPVAVIHYSDGGYLDGHSAWHHLHNRHCTCTIQAIHHQPWHLIGYLDTIT
jgi:hypothetical protein